MSLGSVKNKIQSIIFIIILSVLTYLLLKNSSELFSVISLIKHADYGFIALAVIIQIFYFLLYSILYSYVFKHLLIPFRFSSIYASIQKMYFFNLLGTSGGIGGMIPFFTAGRRKKYLSTSVFTGYIIVSISLFTTIGFLVTFSAISLKYHNQLTSFSTLEILLYYIFLAFVLTLFSLFLFSPKKLHLVIEKASLGINWLAGLLGPKNVIKTSYLERKMDEIIETGKLIKSNYHKYLISIPLFLAMHFIEMIIIMIVFKSIGESISFGQSFVIYSMVVLVSIISPTPHGAGIVEGSVPMVIRPLGIEISQAITAIMLFRLITIWIPVIAGYALTIIEARLILKVKPKIKDELKPQSLTKSV